MVDFYTSFFDRLHDHVHIFFKVQVARWHVTLGKFETVRMC